jgi:hypothetical protein
MKSAQEELAERGQQFQLGGLSDRMDARSEIINQFELVARQQSLSLSPLRDDLELLNTGLDSLSFAIVVTRLEELLGVDPFTSSEDATLPLTFGEFVEFYENAST